MNNLLESMVGVDVKGRFKSVPSRRVETIAFLGLGQMGRPMALRLIAGGYRVVGYDPDPNAAGPLVQQGGRVAPDEITAVEQADCTMLCLPTSDATIELGHRLLNRVAPGQIVVDHGTTAIPPTVQLAGAFQQRRAAWVDAPISGGPGGAKRGFLRLWAGGDPVSVGIVLPLFNAFASHVTHMGGPGSGQAGKAVHQLKAGLTAAAMLEAISFGLRAGLDPTVLRKSFEGSDPAFDDLLKKVESGDPCPAESKFFEFEYYLQAARAGGFHLPMMETLLALCRDEPRQFRDPVNRPVPSIWQALMQANDTARPLKPLVAGVRQDEDRASDDNGHVG
jgi:3-hydroxyisobutyrate dehydrogenase-like beta-hydroxyacid dehydrogenase